METKEHFSPKEYIAPELVELGNLSGFTKYNNYGQNFDGTHTEDDHATDPDIFGDAS